MFASRPQFWTPLLLNSAQTVPKTGATKLTFDFESALRTQSGLGSKIGTTCRCLLKLSARGDDLRQFWPNLVCCASKTANGALSRNYASGLDVHCHSSTNFTASLSYHAAEWSD